MDRPHSKFFWALDHHLPHDVVKSYKESLGSFKSSGLERWISMIEAKIPISPRAYVTLDFLKATLQKLPSDAMSDLAQMIERFEQLTHCQFAGREKPLLLTVKGDYCGAVRNIGVCPKTLPALIHLYGSATAYGLYVDFLESYSQLVLGAGHIDFRKTFQISAERHSGGDSLAQENDQNFLKKVLEFQNLVSQKIGRSFPDRPETQLISTLIYAGRTAKPLGGDEVLVQTQVHRSCFGQSIQGVVYTRDPFTGSRDVYGVYQYGLEGRKSDLSKNEQNSLKAKFPAIYEEIVRYLPKIESSCREVMEAEFVTDEDGNLRFTQFDKAETTARAAVLSTVELNKEAVISDREAVERLKSSDLELLLHPSLDDESKKQLKPVGSSGVTAAPGTSVGRIFFRMRDAIQFHQDALKNRTDKRVILIADELLISDTPGLGMIGGLVTKASGIASHAAVMARANGIPCIVGFKGLEVDPNGQSCRIDDHVLKAGDMLTLDAALEGKLYQGEGRVNNLSFKEGVIQDVSRLITRVSKQERISLEVRVNINGPKDAEVGLSFGADGVGLCRTENMFMASESLSEIRKIVFTPDPQQCKDSFEKLEEIQFRDFKKIFELMGNRVVNIRLMDLPLHDFVPQTESDFEELCGHLSHLSREQIRSSADKLREHNPMLGLRACRFGLITPAVYDLQIRAIIRAAYASRENQNLVNPGIMFPLVFLEEELTLLKGRVLEIDEEVRESLRVPMNSQIYFRVGSMIELPAAALSADYLSRVGEFFAFGTNDLTQTTLGMSRDDSAHYLPHYLEKGLLGRDPFKILSDPVRELIEIAVRRGRRVRPDASFGICGEQGGDVSTLLFCLEKGLDYVSCSPFRVLPTRLALAKLSLSVLMASVRDESQTLSASYTSGIDPSPKLKRAG